MKLREILRTFLLSQHQSSMQYAPFWGPIFGLFYILFYYGLSAVGMHEWPMGRFLSAGLLTLPAILPLKYRLTRSCQIYMECVYIFCLPYLFSYLLMLNNLSSYWCMSMVFCGVGYAMVGWTPLALVAFPVTVALTIDHYAHLIPANHLVNAYLVLAVSYLALVVGVIIVKTTIKFHNDFVTKIKVQDALNAQLKANIAELEKRERIISTFIRPSLLREVSSDKNPLEYGPTQIEASILFTDMRDYTSMAEASTDAELYSCMNEYFALVNEAVFGHNGEVDKIIGDAVMAIFKDPHDCLRAYLEMRKTMSARNRRRQEASQKLYKYGTGIAHGHVLSGNYGSPLKYDRTIMGDEVNIASRLQGLTKEYCLDVIASEEFIRKVPGYEYARPLDVVRVKGKQSYIKIYELFEHNIEEVVEFKLRTRDRLDEAIHARLECRARDSLQIIQELITQCPAHRLKEAEIMDPYLKVMLGKYSS